MAPGQGVLSPARPQRLRGVAQAVGDELARQQQAEGTASSNGHTAGANGKGNGHAAQRRSTGRRATASQARALRSIADRLGLDLAAELQNRFGVDDPAELSITEASQTIDELKGITNGVGGRR